MVDETTPSNIDLNSLLKELANGYIIPAPRAVLLGIKGDNINSVNIKP